MSAESTYGGCPSCFGRGYVERRGIDVPCPRGCLNGVQPALASTTERPEWCQRTSHGPEGWACDCPKPTTERSDDEGQR